MSDNEQFWSYDPFSGLVSQMPSEEVAVFWAQDEKKIYFVASLYDIREYPQAVGTQVILGPGVVQEGPIVTVNGAVYYKTCGVPILGDQSHCIKPYRHRSNQHEDQDGNVHYA